MNNIQPIYQAHWPKSLKPTDDTFSAKLCKVASAIFGTISGYRSLKSLFAQNLHSASSSKYDKNPLLDDLREELFHLGADPVQLTTPDDHLLDGAIFRGDVPKAVVLMLGTGDTYETEGKLFLKFIRRELGNVTVLLFNPRGVGQSQGPSTPDKLRLDAYTAIEYLIEAEHFPIQDILSYEFSLGGAYGNEGAVLAQEESDDQSPMVFVENSFSDLESVLQAHLGNTFTFSAARKLLRHYDWGMNSRAAWEKLHGPKALIANVQDTVIPPSASLYTAFPDDGIQIGDPNGDKEWHYHLPAYRNDLETAYLIGKKLRELLLF